MTLVRILILTGLVLAAFPIDAAQRTEMVERLQARAEWVWQTCDRDPEFCAEAASAWHGFIDRAEAALVVSFEFVRMALFTDPPVATGDVEQSVRHGTLTRADLEPAWSAPRP